MDWYANNIHVVKRIANKIVRGEREFGRVSVKEDGQYLLLNYTSEAQFSSKLTRVEEACRGLVIRKDGKVMALPFNKFYNLGEPHCPSLPSKPYTVWEKVDGSLGIFWYEHSDNPNVPSRWRCNTRGSFNNAYIAFAQGWWDRNVNVAEIPSHYTILVEICLDDDEMTRAAAKDERLYLIGCRDRETGEDISIDDIHIDGIDGLIPAERVNKTIDQILGERDITERCEGWVVRFDDGFRVKVKTAWYLRLFRTIQSLTKKRVREMMVEEIETGRDWIAEMPDDVRPDAVALRDEIESQWKRELEIIANAYLTVGEIEDRKEFASRVLSDFRSISSWLFKMKDGKFDEVDVLIKMDLSGGE